MEQAIEDAIKRIILANYKACKTGICTQELARLVADKLKTTIPMQTVQTVLDKLKEGNAVDGDRSSGYVPLYSEVE